jgi:hypothetical protein
MKAGLGQLDVRAVEISEACVGVEPANVALLAESLRSGKNQG